MVLLLVPIAEGIDIAHATGQPAWCFFITSRSSTENLLGDSSHLVIAQEEVRCYRELTKTGVDENRLKWGRSAAAINCNAISANICFKEKMEASSTAFVGPRLHKMPVPPRKSKLADRPALRNFCERRIWPSLEGDDEGNDDAERYRRRGSVSR